MFGSVPHPKPSPFTGLVAPLQALLAYATEARGCIWKSATPLRVRQGLQNEYLSRRKLFFYIPLPRGRGRGRGRGS